MVKAKGWNLILWALAMGGAAIGGAVSPSLAADRKTLLIGSGEVSGYYYPVAGAMCRVVNKEKPQGLGCAVVPSAGSAANLVALRAHETDFALVQSRAALAAANGTDAFAEQGPFADLRAVLWLHGESVVLLARPGSGIAQIGDIKGKRVNMGRPGSFQRMMADVTLEASGLSEGDLSPAVELDLSEQGGELCDGNIDAAFFTGVHPMPEVAETIDGCDAIMVEIKGKNMDAYVKANPWLGKTILRQGTYDAQKGELPSLHMRTLLVTTAQQDKTVVADVVKSVHSNFGPFSHLHPVLGHLTKADLTRDAMPIKRHEGSETTEKP